MNTLKLFKLNSCLLLLIAVVTSCKKEEITAEQSPETSTGYYSPYTEISAGDEQDAQVESPYLTLLEDEFSIDIDHDGKKDLELVSLGSYSQSGFYYYYKSYLKLYEGCDVVVDSSEVTKYTYTSYNCADSFYRVNNLKVSMPLIRPKALDVGEQINQNSPWYHSQNSLEFNSMHSQKQTDLWTENFICCRVYENEIQASWSNQPGDKFIGVRKVLSRDTLYGWIKLSFDEGYMHWIDVEKYAFR